MSVIRYSGLVTVRITYDEIKCGYRVYLSTPTTLRLKGKSMFVGERSLGADGYPTRAVDNPSTYDAVARHAVARQAWEDLWGDFIDLGVREWTCRPSYEQCAWTTIDGVYPTPGHLIDRGIDTGRADIIVHRSQSANGRWMMDHPLACHAAR